MTTRVRKSPGRVAFVGSGPGDTGLLTVRAADLLERAELLVTDPDVPSEVLRPRTTWANGADYDTQAAKLARMFVENFKNFEPGVTADVLAAGPNA